VLLLRIDCRQYLRSAGPGQGKRRVAYKLAWFRRFRNFLDQSGSPSGRLIWCGDLNVAPEPIDVHNPRGFSHVCFTPEVWEAFSLVKHGVCQTSSENTTRETWPIYVLDYRVPSSVERGWDGGSITYWPRTIGGKIGELYNRHAAATEKSLPTIPLYRRIRHLAFIGFVAFGES